MKQPLFKNILYATDLSQTAKQAARYALSLAHEYGAELTVINVIPDLVEEMSAGMGYDLVSHFGPEKLSSFYTEGHCCLINFPRAIFVAKPHVDCLEA